MTDSEPNIRLVVRPEAMAGFYPALQRGVVLAVQVGCSISELLSLQLGIPEDYVRERVSTLFLNGKAIDNFDQAPVREGSVVSLSGAMPGLVGATMRSGGHLAAMREAITYHADSVVTAREAGRVKLKLFNLVLPELAPVVLHWGICIPAAEFRGILQEQNELFTQSVIQVFLDSHGEVRLEELLRGAFLEENGPNLKLSVHIAGDPS